MEEIYKDFPRQLNCLTNENKATRRRAIEAIRKEVVKKLPRPDSAVVNEVLHELIRPLLTMFSDPVAGCRELAISVISELIQEVSSPRDFLQFIVPTLVQRLGQQNIIEPMEEVRLQLVVLIHKLIKLTEKGIAPFLDDMIKILQRTIVDPFAEVKKESCGCASSLAKTIPEHFHMQSESLIAPLTQKDTLGHQHSKVRVAAVRTIGDVIRYGNGKSVDDVVSPLAQMLFDATPAVRQAVTQVMGDWLLDLPDRYSFHHKLIPLLLTNITDEYPTIQKEAEVLWQDIGEKYASENDKELKDKMDFAKPDPKNYPLEIERPNLGCRVLVYHNFSKILSGIIGDLTHSGLVPMTKIKSAQLLYVLLINEEENVTQHLEKVLAALKGSCNDEEKLVREYIFKSAKLLGYFVTPSIWCKMVLQNIRFTVHSDVPSDSLPGLLSLLAAFIEGSEGEYLRPHLTEIADVIGDPSVCRFPATKLQLSVLSVVESIINISVEDCRGVSGTLFDVLVSVIALHRQDIAKEQAEKLLLELAKVQSIDREMLFRNHLKPMLDSMENSYESWTQHSTERFVFDTLLIEAGPVVDSVLDNVMKILQANLSPDKDVDIRSKFFSLLSHLVMSSNDVKDSEHRFGEFAVTIIRDMILPNCVWKAGRTAEVIRKMAVLCLRIVLSKEGFVTSEKLLNIMDELLTRLRSTLDDDGRETRLVTCQILSRIFILVGDQLPEDQQLYNMYPELLKRLDDSSDDVRIAATETFSAYFGCLCKNFQITLYRAHLEAIYKGLLLHMDDSQEKVQQAVLETLKAGAHVEPDMLLKEIEGCRHKLRCTASCDELVRFINALPKPE